MIKLAKSKFILENVSKELVRNIYIQSIIKKIYLRKFGNFDCIKLNQSKYIKTIIAKLKGILNISQLKLKPNIINIGDSNIYISELKLVLRK